MNDSVMQKVSSPDTQSDTLVVSDRAIVSGVSPVSEKKFDSGFFLSAVVALGVAILIRFFVAAPFIVSGSSMEPNFYDYHYLIVDRLTYDFSTPTRGDVIVLDLPEDTGRALIKRVIGLPGETVELSGPAPTVTIINKEHPMGFTLAEPYLDKANLGGATNMKVTLLIDQYFVLGDNRKVSSDSRIWGILPRKDIVGRVFVRLFPFNAISLLPAESRYAGN